MEKFRLWHGDEPKFVEVRSISEAMLMIRKNEKLFPEESSGLQQFENGVWDEWLDEEDQTIHEHMYMFNQSSRYLVDLDDEDFDFDDEYDFDDEMEEEEFVSDDEDRFISEVAAGVTDDDIDDEDEE